MGIDRRDFIRLAGLCAAAGMAGKACTSAPASPRGEYERGDEGLEAHRWAMVIDLGKCREKPGCRDCITACHREHNVPEMGNPKDEVKWIWTEEFEHAFPTQENHFINEETMHGPVPVLCNHCDNPPCVRVCPVTATWKREDGIVMMDWHRCIGCRYCIAACPYGSRSFNWRDPRPHLETVNKKFPTRTRGVVEKCTFCDERLAVGKMPACVEACAQKALAFGDLEDPNAEVRKMLHERFSIRRKPGLGTQPEIYYLV